MARIVPRLLLVGLFAVVASAAQAVPVRVFYEIDSGTFFDPPEGGGFPGGGSILGGTVHLSLTSTNGPVKATLTRLTLTGTESAACTAGCLLTGPRYFGKQINILGSPFSRTLNFTVSRYLPKKIGPAHAHVVALGASAGDLAGKLYYFTAGWSPLTIASFTGSEVPEPATGVSLGTGVLALIAYSLVRARRRRRQGDPATTAR
jgi:hypothetical protein